MTSSHIFYIPLILLLGFVLGVVLGRRSALVTMEEEARRARRAEERTTRAPAAPARDDEELPSG